MGHPFPNLFQFATGELSQDAFIAWLISWANPEYASRNTALHETGVELLNTLLEKTGHPRPEQITSVDVQMQVKNIDLLVMINGTIPLVIEDKTFTSDHSGQLERYLDEIRTLCPNFTGEIPAIYFKTGDQSNYRSAEQAKYTVFNRSDFLKLLQSGVERGVTSDIFINYRDHLKQLDNEVESYGSVLVKDWKPKWNGWVGFFKLLQQKLGGGEWGYVPTVSGGFMCIHWHHSNPTPELPDFELYLQLEEAKLCFKIQVLDVKQQAVQWEKWHKKLKDASDDLRFPFNRPARRKNGNWMTVGFNDDYLQEQPNGKLDIDATVAVLKKAEEVLEAAAAL